MGINPINGAQDVGVMRSKRQREDAYGLKYSISCIRHFFPN